MVEGLVDGEAAEGVELDAERERQRILGGGGAGDRGRAASGGGGGENTPLVASYDPPIQTRTSASTLTIWRAPKIIS